MIIFCLIVEIIKRCPHILWSEIFKSQLESRGAMALLIDGSHCQKARTTIYGIYNKLELQDKFGSRIVELVLRIKVN